MAPTVGSNLSARVLGRISDPDAEFLSECLSVASAGVLDVTPRAAWPTEQVFVQEWATCTCFWSRLNIWGLCAHSSSTSMRLSLSGCCFVATVARARGHMRGDFGEFVLNSVLKSTFFGEPNSVPPWSTSLSTRLVCNHRAACVGTPSRESDTRWMN